MSKMKINKILLGLMAAAIATGAVAQEQLHQEIVLDKDFVPVEKKATRKSSLPQVVKPAKPATRATLATSDWTEHTQVNAGIPTMLPYGYRTGHLFAKERGYFDIGAGTQANVAASAGYRFVDKPTLQVAGWFNHSSSWVGKNSTKLITDDADRLKQKWCDNVLGVDMENLTQWGTLDLSAKFHFDSFNYYGGRGDWWDDNRQMLVDNTVKGDWRGKFDLADHRVDYTARVGYNFAGYNKSFSDLYDGADEHVFKLGFGARYEIEPNSGAGLDLDLAHQYRTLSNNESGATTNGKATIVTARPFYEILGEQLTARLGVRVDYSFSDGAKLRLAPNVNLAYELAPGASLFADIDGGKRLNTIASMAALTRYADPLAGYCNTFSPFDGEAGLKIGPFQGFTAKIFAGYGVFKDQQSAYVPQLGGSYMPHLLKDASQPAIAITAANQYAPVLFTSHNARGFRAGAELSYRYRSLAEFALKGEYAPQTDDFEDGKYYKGYQLGLDNAEFALGASVKVTPIRQLTVDLGFDLRGGRRQLVRNSEGALQWADLDDMSNLHLCANYRIMRGFTVWVQGNNLLNSKTDVFMGQGAQKLGVMGGIGVVF